MNLVHSNYPTKELPEQNASRETVRYTLNAEN